MKTCGNDIVDFQYRSVKEVIKDVYGGIRYEQLSVSNSNRSISTSYDEEHVYYERHGDRRCFTYIGYAWKPMEDPAPTVLNGFPAY